MELRYQVARKTASSHFKEPIEKANFFAATQGRK